MSLTVRQVSKLYCIEPVDYEYSEHGIFQNRGNWLLVAAGCGLMMAVMDQEPRFRWCVDIDTIRDPRARLEDWLIGMTLATEADGSLAVGRVCVVGGWAVTKPDVLVAALRAIKQKVTVYPTTVQDPDPFLGFDRAHSLADFFERLRADDLVMEDAFV